ncbi:3446_t:CDS:1, partial [Funneliformis geosporum]
VASQLNLEKLHYYLFLTRWFKDPNDQNIMKMYQVFYNLVGSSSNQNVNNGNSPETNDDDYEYLLN